MGGRRVVLLDPCGGDAARQVMHDVDESRAAQARDFCAHLGVGALTGLHAALTAVGAGIEALLDAHDGIAQRLVAREQRALHGGGAATLGQHAGVHVEATQARHLDDVGRQDGAVRGHAEHVGVGLGKGGLHLVGAHRLRLHHGDAMLIAPGRDRRGNELLAAPRDGIGPGEGAYNLDERSLGESLERTEGELGRAHEHAAELLHPGPTRCRRDGRRWRAPPGTRQWRACARQARGARTWCSRAGGRSHAAGTRRTGCWRPCTA